MRQSSSDGVGVNASSSSSSDALALATSSVLPLVRDKDAARRSGGDDDVYVFFRLTHTGSLLLLPVVLLVDVLLPSLLWLRSSAFGSATPPYPLLFLPSLPSLATSLSLLLVNGLCYASYNLASTSLLSGRVSLISHASLNCLRRMFAIVVTSLAFGTQLCCEEGYGKAAGVACTVGGFAAFSAFKERRRRRSKRGEEEGDILLTKNSRNKSGGDDDV